MYQTEIEGQHYELGTSGFLYRSNKVMYDHETKSCWSTLHGKPIMGSLVGKGLQLKRRYVVTTTWGEWKKRHPDTTVLSLNTGHIRDYGEGMAYREYFSHEGLMFAIPKSDRRLRNKAQVVTLRQGDQQLAVSAKFLESQTVYQDQINGLEFVILTDRSGGNRVYESGGFRFIEWDQDETVVDDAERSWRVTEDALTDSDGNRLQRLPSHRAFWFGWHAQFPDTRLVK